MQRRSFLGMSLSLSLCSAYGRGLLLSGVGGGAAIVSGAANAALDIPPNTWVRRTGPVSPLGPTGPNKHVKMTYNSKDKKVYLIGGDYNINGIENGASHEMVYRYDVAADTWENVLSYTNSARQGYPEGRCAPGWAYDSKRDVMWFGMGQNRQSEPRPGLQRGGLWSFDPKVNQDSGEVWKLEGPDVPNPWSAGSPKLHPNTGADVWYMQYDPGTDALYVPYRGGGRWFAKYDLAGATIRNGVSKDNWSYTSVPIANDYFLGELSFALDTKRSRFVFYVPWPGLTESSPAVDRGETWEYSTVDGTWTKLSDTVLPARCCFGMVYDSANDKIVLVAGYDSHEGGIGNPLNQVWVLDRDPASANYHKWVRLAVAGTPPSPRKGETIAYDVANNVIVQFGGRGWDSQPDASDVFLLRLGGTSPSVPSPPTDLRAQ
jgi:hypothetical protein